MKTHLLTIFLCCTLYGCDNRKPRSVDSERTGITQPTVNLETQRANVRAVMAAIQANISKVKFGSGTGGKELKDGTTSFYVAITSTAVQLAATETPVEFQISYEALVSALREVVRITDQLPDSISAQDANNKQMEELERRFDAPMADLKVALLDMMASARKHGVNL